MYSSLPSELVTFAGQSHAMHYDFLIHASPRGSVIRPYVAFGAGVKFFRGIHHISADFCFGCDIVMFGRDGQPFSGEDFDEASPAIFEVVRSLFPEDRVILEILASKKRRQEMEAEIRRLRMENEFLKKAAAFFARTQP